MRKLLTLLLLAAILLPLSAREKKLIFDSVHNKGTEITVPVDWSLKLFENSPKRYDDELAKSGAVLSRSIYVSDRRLEKNLKKLGFRNLRIYDSNDEVSMPVCAFAYQRKKGVNYFMIVVRGTYSVKDIITDLKSVVDSFYHSAEYVLEEFRSYVEEMEPKDFEEGNNVFFMTGHSLGAAACNHLSVMLEEFTSEDRIFTYTFECPSTNIPEEERGRSLALNLINAEDYVPTLPPPEGRYGTDIVYHPEDLDPELYLSISGEILDRLTNFSIRSIGYNHFLDQSLTYVLQRSREAR
ncbi:MAG: hypothetical protein IJ831_04315 [Spirochaetales bacterium]|nr:hypothetical protein [Spirochaetales bacterium]